MLARLAASINAQIHSASGNNKHYRSGDWCIRTRTYHTFPSLPIPKSDLFFSFCMKLLAGAADSKVTDERIAINIDYVAGFF